MEYLKILQKKQAAIVKEAEQYIIRNETPLVVAVIIRLIQLLPKIQKIHPDITGFRFGMGHAIFMGVAHGRYKENFQDGEPTDIDGTQVDDYLDDPETYVFKMKTNKAMYEALELIRYFVKYDDSQYNLLQPDGLNASTLIDEIQGDTVIFERDEVVTSPFGHEPLAATKKSPLYKQLRKAGVKTKFVPQR